MASEQMTSPACEGFELLPMVMERMLFPVCDGSEPLPVALEQMPLPAAPETEQESLSVELEDAVACGAREVTGAATNGYGADAVAYVARDGAGAVEQMTSPITPGTEHESSTLVLEQMPLPICDGFNLSHVASEQMPYGFEPPPVGAKSDAVTLGA